MALSAYRHLLRSIRIAFQGDSRVLFAARDKARQDFDALRTLAPHSPEAQAGVAHAREVARVLRTNVVQGVQVEEEKYQLRIHSETERGDNNTVKMGRKSVTDTMGGCCGGAR